MLTAEERERYARQLMLREIGLEGQEKLQATRVLVVGAGGLGDLIITGNNISRVQVWSLGALYATSIALLLDHILGVAERVLTEQK